MRLTRTIFMFLALALSALSVFGQTLSPAQKTTLRTAMNTAFPVRDDVAMTAWCNAASATDAWPIAAEGRAMFEAIDITKYDGLTAGKRAAWDLLSRNAPINFTKAKFRTAVVDMWGAADAVAVLQGLREKATNCQAAIGGTTRTTQTVSALDRNWTGTLGLFQVSDILNNAP